MRMPGAALAPAAGVPAEAAKEPVCSRDLLGPGEERGQRTHYNLSPSVSWPRLRSQGFFF